MKRFGLSKKDRIKKKKEFDTVYSSGTTLFSESKRFKVVFLIERNCDKACIKVAFGVYKKAGNAVWRNRVKRLMRESYRLNKLFLYSKCKSNSCSLLMVFSPSTVNSKKNKSITLSDVQPEIIDLMKQIEAKI